MLYQLQFAYQTRIYYLDMNYIHTQVPLLMNRNLPNYQRIQPINQMKKKKRGIQPINQKKKGSNPNQHGVGHQKLSLLSSVYIVMISTFHSPNSEEYDQKNLDMSHPL